MIPCKSSVICLLPARILLNELALRYYATYNKKINTENKRGSVLENMIKDRDKRKNWHFEIAASKPKARVFDKIHRPHRRRAVLNSLFISNITDVLSTSDVIPDIQDLGIEISGVQVSPCLKILNIFWQVPTRHNSLSEDIDKKLAIAAPKIRAELISRNVMGRVPHLYFLRDCTNARVAAFEEAAMKLEQELKDQSGVVVNEDFLQDIYSFKSAKAADEKEQCKLKHENEEIKVDQPANPHKPVGMRNDVCGLNHSLMMEKVLASKKKSRNPPQNTAVIDPLALDDVNDLFSKIPGVCFQTESRAGNNAKSRDEILKKFSIERKLLRQKKQTTNDIDNCQLDGDDYDEDAGHYEINPSDFDYIEDESTGK